ncbi:MULTISPECIES: restriction endonuclease subunit S [unclassified Mycoplasma]|uniref:restriction endonuclease subunit S n=1 Tax=unclassified Mycoplasma TaxID=2683645 RepID=UPI00211C792D|nr:MULTISPECIES: restriction endonuclease subunit S [unclassified Mycoplasma]UUM19876.1 restriction endonuclease subunit S [Mycoplasma sp. 1578d]UUM24860.1 restriction endonuclease subunit S [Mycoplasma sp. 3686d]
MKKINTNQWKEFCVGELFKIHRIEKTWTIGEVIEVEKGIPYITRKKFNNGIKFRVEKTNNMKLNPEGVISFGAENTTFFYQKEPFITGNNMFLIDTRELSEKACLFLISCLQTLARWYSYNDGLNAEALSKEKIKLPVNDKNTPDWEYMEKYILKLEGKLEKMVNLINYLENKDY